MYCKFARKGIFFGRGTFYMTKDNQKDKKQAKAEEIHVW
jgi:hypothetical protein